MRHARAWAAVVLLFMAGAPALAGDGADPTAAGEAVLTLRVDGQLTIDPEGRVSEYRVEGSLDPAVAGMLQRAVPAWRFKPILVDGKPATATSPMRITLAAEEMAEGYRVKVDNVVFWPNTPEQHAAAEASRMAHPDMRVAGEAPRPGVRILSKTMRPPVYPPEMMQAGVEGIVLLSLRLHPDGSVAEAFASQSSLLNVKGRPEILDRGRMMLERNASTAARRWKFTVLAEDAATLAPGDLTVRVPVEYRLGVMTEGGSLAGQWRHEFRGPNRPAPWLPPEEATRVRVSDLNTRDILAGRSPFELSDRSVIGKAL